MKPILIGMNNPLSMDSKYALYPLPKRSAGGHLWRMLWEEARVTPRQYVNAFERVNLVVGKWDAGRARAASLELHSSLQRRHVVFLGDKVRCAFGHPKMAISKPYSYSSSVYFYQVPHPSGRNLWYNDPENRRAIGRLLAYLYNLSKEDAT
jgi:hypothetical protein